MIAFKEMLLSAAKDAGMNVPDSELCQNSELDSLAEEYPHFFVFCMVQLCRPMKMDGEHFRNAEVVANVPGEQIKSITLNQLIDNGLEYPV